MIIYSVTARVRSEIAGEFTEWMTSKHVPDVVHTGCFLEAFFCKPDAQSGNDEISFIIQYHCSDRERLDRYLENYAPVLRKEFNDRYGEKCVLSRSVMEVVKEIQPHSW